MEEIISDDVEISLGKLSFRHLRLDSQMLDGIYAEGGKITVVSYFSARSEHTSNRALSRSMARRSPKRGVAATLVNNVALRVHYVVVIQETLTNAKVVFFHLLLRPLDALGDHGMLKNFTFLMSHLVHQRRDTLGIEETHKVVLKAHKELRGTRIALTAGTTTKLTVYTA
jgi:hypothetical protein